MRKPYLNLTVILALLIGLLALTPAKATLADCVENAGGGDPSDILCATDDANGVTTQGNGSNTDPDVVTVEAGVTVESGGGDAVEGYEELSVYNDGIILGEGGDGVDAGDDVITLTNTGTISGTWEGVDIDYDIEGVLDNTGSIIGEYGSGIAIGSDLDGTLYNSGTITGGDEGVEIGDDLEGSLYNSGNIFGYWDGVDIEDHLGGTLDNYGDIVGQYGQGVDISDDLDGTLNNFGYISGYSTGVYIDEDIDGSLYNSGDIVGYYDEGIYVDEDADLIYNDTTGGIWGYWDGVDVGEDATIYNDGVVFGLWGDAVDIDGNAVVFNDVNGVLDGYDTGLQVGGDALVDNAGEILAYDGDGIAVEGSAVIVNTGYIWGDDEGIDTNNGYETYIYSNGVIEGEDTAIDSSYYNDVVYLGGNSVTIGGDDGAMELYDGDDIVYLGGGAVSYSTACQDIGVTTIDNESGATVIGTMFGDEGGYGGYDDTDTLIFGVVAANEAEAAAFLAGLDAEGGSVSDGHGGTYDWAFFEVLSVDATIFTLGPTRLFDDGVVLAFTTNGGIDVCSGEKGFRAGTVNFAQLDNGQRTFSAGNEGWFVVVNDLGGGRFEAHIFDGSGVEHFNDANEDGVADSTFVFSR